MQKIRAMIRSNKLFLPVSLAIFALSAKLASAQLDVGLHYGDEIGLGNNDPVVMITKFINIVLALLGLLAIIIILVAGFRWMTAGGDTAKVDSAKKWLINGLIGLILIFAAWGITRWVITNLANLTGLDNPT